jgi:VanZ family protein
MLQRNTLITIAQIGFWVSLTGAVTMAVLPNAPHLPFEFGDKIQHMLAFAALTFGASFAWPEAPRMRILERLSFVGALIEVLQSIPQLHRDCDIRDWIADTAAIAAVLLILWVLRLPQSMMARIGD